MQRLCKICGEPAGPKKLYCYIHLKEYNRQKSKEHYYKKIKNGIHRCSICGRSKAEQGICISCSRTIRFQKSITISQERINRFWSYINISSENECWNWTRSITSSGYGCFGIGQGKRISAHRFAYEIINGQIPDNMCVLHYCDNKLCCNPKHLHIGNIALNNKEARERGLNPRGEKNGNAKLRNNEVIEILKSCKSSLELSLKYHVRQETINSIRRRKTWKHIDVHQPV